VPVLLALLILGFLVVPFSRPRVSPPHANCPNNLKQLGLAVSSYQADHNGKLPDPDNWPQHTLEYVRSQGIYRCPSTAGRRMREYPIRQGDWTGSMAVTYAMNE